MKKHYPLLSAIAALALILAASWWQVQRATGGHFCYPLDDSFIHLSIARHLAENGVWGINAGEYSAASSSPLYTGLLALLMRAGLNGLLLPFWLNVCFALLLLYTANRILLRYQLRPFMIFCILQAMVWLVPFTVMIFSGMEHLLHAWLALWFIQRSVELLQAPAAGWKGALITGLAGALAILTRFESLFMLAGVLCMLIYYRRFGQAAMVLAIALLPVVLAGWLSMQHGGYFLPNSVLLKGSNLGGGWQRIKSALEEIVVFRLTYGNNTLINTFSSKFAPAGAPSLSGASLLRLLTIIPVLLLFIRPVNNSSQRARQFACIWLITCLLHLALAAVGWLFRYEAWLIGTGIFAAGLLISLEYARLKELFRQQWLPGQLAGLFLALFMAVPLLLRAASATTVLPKACKNIYEQQFQMAAFLEQYYQHQAIAANDIGAISYYGRNRIIDLWGLGNNKVAASKLQQRYTPAFLYDLTQKEQVSLAIIYDDWIPAALREHWIKVGSWKISNNVICGGDEVSFYATDNNQAALLRRRLQAFSSKLPADVQVRLNRD